MTVGRVPGSDQIIVIIGCDAFTCTSETCSFVLKTSGRGVDETPAELALAVLTWELADVKDKLCLFFTFVAFCLLLLSNFGDWVLYICTGGNEQNNLSRHTFTHTHFGIDKSFCT